MSLPKSWWMETVNANIGYIGLLVRPEIIKTFFMLNSTNHDIYLAHKL